MKYLVKLSFATCAFFALLATAITSQALAETATADAWIEQFQPSSLSKDEQKREIDWFVRTAQPFRGMEIQVVSENIATHEYESKVLAKAFSELTGIKVTHDLVNEGGIMAVGLAEKRSGGHLTPTLQAHFAADEVARTGARILIVDGTGEGGVLVYRQLRQDLPGISVVPANFSQKGAA